VLLYLITIAFSVIVTTASGLPFLDAVGGVIGCLGGVGPGLGSLGPMGNYAHIPDFTKWFFSFLMLIGRLELFTVLLLFTPIFWKR
jgi:trk system potassium uptake protein